MTNPLEWSFYENGSRLSVRVQPRMIVNSLPRRDGRRRPRGNNATVFLPCGPEVLNGTLLPVLTAFEPESTPVNLLHVERRGASGKIRAFVEFVTETLRRNVHLQQHMETAMAMNGTSGILSSVK